MPGLRSVSFGEVEIHYLERGEGLPLVFVHGGMDDYRYWLPFMDKPGHRGVTYSRRYNYPNSNTLKLPDYSALTDLADLEALLGRLKITTTVMVGQSYGAFVALLYALRHPGSVSSLVLCEPPVMGWLDGIPGGAEVLADFEDRLWLPFRAAIVRGDRNAALRCAVAFFGGPDSADSLPPGAQDMLSNLLEWEVLTASTAPFPVVDPREVESLKVRTLIMTGEETLRLHSMINDQLAGHLRGSRSVQIPDASHDMWRDNPSACDAELRAFLSL